MQSLRSVFAKRGIRELVCESVPVQLTAGANEITHTFDLKGQNEPEGWNEYTPVLYEMRVEISGETSGGTYADEKRSALVFGISQRMSGVFI